ncbi:hypothetical protein D3C76_1669010 [compost metagenome]
MEHPVVTRCHQHRYGTAGHGDTLLDRAQATIEQAFAALGLVHRGHAQPAQGVDHLAGGTGDIAYDDASLADQRAHARLSVTRGKTLRRPSA